MAFVLHGHIVEYEGQRVINLGYGGAVEICATEPAPMGYFMEPIVGLYEV